MLDPDVPEQQEWRNEQLAQGKRDNQRRRSTMGYPGHQTGYAAAEEHPEGGLEESLSLIHISEPTRPY